MFLYIKLGEISKIWSCAFKKIREAFFTDFETSVSDLINTYAQPVPGSVDFAHFLVAEDPGGINTGVFMVRNSAWSLRFLERVASSTFTVAWET